MSRERRKPAFTQADIARVIRAAKQTGVATEVEVRIGAASIVVRLSPSTSTETVLAKLEQIIL